MKIAVRVKSHHPNNKPINIIVDVPNEFINDENILNDICHDEVEDKLGDTPKWIRLLGVVDITPLSYYIKKLK